MAETPGEVTGMLMVRITNMRIPDRPDKKIVMVFGVIAVDEDSPLVTEHQYPVAGADIPGALQLNLLTDAGQDMSGYAKGMRADQLLTAPIWRV